ncbi:hypothetical protein FGO68_gene15034 [Halteria grandinella]|uniref:Uncharacterized protein n=1 Tax=Halteria grandinella TaxID=5974 RepID=A0A8J8NBU6_HALGN|nr:hypothetical protein FGO68_gene15034 [Halteria grandinella]
MKRENTSPKKEADVRLRIVLVDPPPGVDFGVQEGKGNDYTTIQKQRSKGADLTFEFTVTVKDNRDDGLPNFLGPLTHGPTTGRFIYIDIGTYAGQLDSCWDRRLKIPLGGITWEMIEKASTQMLVEARLPGTGKDGGPSCATVQPIDGWKVSER